MRRVAVTFCLLLFLAVLLPSSAGAQSIPKISIGVESSDDPGNLSVALQILILLTVLSLAPSIVLTMTSFTRIVVVFSFLKHALGTQQMPPAQLLIGLSILLSIFIMKVRHHMGTT